MKKRIDNLINLAKQGNLTKKQSDEVASNLKDPNTKDSRYALLYILGRSGFKSHRDLIESFLGKSEYPDLARLSLQILCLFWNETDRYQTYVVDFLRGASWDYYNECKIIAISISGEFLRDHESPIMLQTLLQIFNNHDEKKLIRESAYRALARAMGLDYKDIPSAAQPLNLKNDANYEIINLCEIRLSKEID